MESRRDRVVKVCAVILVLIGIRLVTIERNDGNPIAERLIDSHQSHATLENGAFAPTTEWKLFIVGDVHGCIDEMRQLVTQYRNNDEILVFVGDLVMKGAAFPRCDR